MGRFSTAARLASYRFFMLADRVGVHVLPKHYYTPLPDYAWLRGNMQVWARPVDMTGVSWDLDSQVAWLRGICAPYYGEVKGLDSYHDAVGAGPGFGPIEYQVLHCFVRARQPKIIEVGSGVSTVCMIGAGATAITCIEPHASDRLRQLPVTLTPMMVQQVPFGQFSLLGEGDLLFIDSSHAVKTGSDVQFLLLEIIPRLRPGVYIHIHDINFPYLYRRNELEDYFDWQEGALLLALLKGNPGLDVLCCLSALHYGRQEQLKLICPDYEPDKDTGPGLGAITGHFPSSIWLRTRSGLKNGYSLSSTEGTP